MNTHTNLVTTYNFRGKEYLVSLHNINHHPGRIEVKVTDKKTSEEWLGSYEASYIENLTQKTGNYKRFDTFISMLKSGLLNTSQCVTLDLLTFDDLEMLRNKISHPRQTNTNKVNSSYTLAPSSNRRYLIVTYTVEFDRIHYPLAMEYCGPPDPKVLQETIQRLEKQITDLEHELAMYSNNWENISNQIEALQKKVVKVTSENIALKEQIKQFQCMPKKQNPNIEVKILMDSIYSLENKLKIKSEKVKQLQEEKLQLSLQLQKAMTTETVLRSQLDHFEPFLENKGHKIEQATYSIPLKKNRSLENCAEKPFRRFKLGGRKIHSARSSYDINYSSSEDLLFGRNDKGRTGLKFDRKISPRSRASSPTLSDLSHNSRLSLCACRKCLHSKLKVKKNDSGSVTIHEKSRGRAKLLKRIQSLEKLISGIILN